MKITCIRCGTAVSTEVPDTTILRGIAECPECLVQDAQDDADRESVRRREDVLCALFAGFVIGGIVFQVMVPMIARIVGG